MKIKSSLRKKRHKVIVITPYSRAITSCESLTSAKEEAKRIRIAFRKHKLQKGTTVYIEPE